MIEYINVSSKRMKEVAYEALLMMGLDDDAAKKGSLTLNAADLRGVDTHGIARLFYYDKLLKNGSAKKNPNMKIIKETPVSAVVDCDNGLGISTAPSVMEIAINKAKEAGIGIAAGINMTHFGIAGFYPIMAAKEDLIGICMCKTGPNSAPIGGKRALLGNSPHSIAFPAGFNSPSIMFDMATTVVAGGKVEMAIRNHQKIPFGWVLDDDGNDTDDPTVFVHRKSGSLGLMGGPKGYCLTVIVELFAGIWSGMEEQGFIMAAIDPNIIRDINEFKKDIDKYYNKIKNSPRKDENKEIFLPGEIEYNKSIKRVEKGVPLNKAVANEVLDIFKMYNKMPQNAAIEDLFCK